jgi:hypothetical protein
MTQEETPARDPILDPRPGDVIEITGYFGRRERIYIEAWFGGTEVRYRQKDLEGNSLALSATFNDGWQRRIEGRDPVVIYVNSGDDTP